MTENSVKPVTLHVFEKGDTECDSCGLPSFHSLHFHPLIAGYNKALCSCGYPPDADCHIPVVKDDEDSLDLSRRIAVDIANRQHDSDVLLQFKAWISAHNQNSITIVELGKVLDIYAFHIRKSALK